MYYYLLILHSYISAIKMTAATKLAITTVSIVFILYICTARQTVEARYLPTRSNSDRIDKLKELLREVSSTKKSPPQSKSIRSVQLLPITQFI